MPSKSRNLWSKSVTEHDHPYDLEPGLFKSNDPKKIAAELKISAEDPRRDSKNPYASAMSMLDFYINRAGEHLTDADREALEQTKVELRRIFGRSE